MQLQPAMNSSCNRNRIHCVWKEVFTPVLMRLLLFSTKLMFFSQQSWWCSVCCHLYLGLQQSMEKVSPPSPLQEKIILTWACITACLVHGHPTQWAPTKLHAWSLSCDLCMLFAILRLLNYCNVCLRCWFSCYAPWLQAVAAEGRCGRHVWSAACTWSCSCLGHTGRHVHGLI